MAVEISSSSPDVDIAECDIGVMSHKQQRARLHLLLANDRDEIPVLRPPLAGGPALDLIRVLDSARLMRSSRTRKGPLACRFVT